MLETKELVALRDEINEAIKTSRRLDRCHQQFLARRKDGITRTKRKPGSQSQGGSERG